MLYLLEITYTDKESVAVYPREGDEPFADELALSAEFDSKLGAAMKAQAYLGEVLVAFDSTGKIIDSAFHYKDNVEAPISDRLLWIKNVDGTEEWKQKKCTDLNEMQGEAYSQRGAAKKNADVLAILNLGVTSGAIVINDYWERPIEPVEPEPEPTPEPIEPDEDEPVESEEEPTE